MRTIYLGLLTFFILFSQNIVAQNYEDSIRMALEKIVARDIVPGFGVSIVNKEGILYEQGFGYAKVESKEAYTPHSIQNIGSVSKTFIGISIMKAVEMGLVELETPINDLLPFKVIHPRHPDKPITLLHLASHTSGIRDGMIYEKSYVFQEKANISLEGLRGRTRKEFQFYLSNQDMSMPDFFQKILEEGGAWYKKKNFYKDAPARPINIQTSEPLWPHISLKLPVGKVSKLLLRSTSSIRSRWMPRAGNLLRSIWKIMPMSTWQMD